MHFLFSIFNFQFSIFSFDFLFSISFSPSIFGVGVSQLHLISITYTLTCVIFFRWFPRSPVKVG